LLVAAVASATALAAAPSKTADPAITPSSQPYVGDTLNVSNGTWSNSPTKFTYQWQRCDAQNCANIAGATSDSYKLVKDDANHRMRAVVTATNADGNASATATSTLVFDAVPPTNTARPTVSGTQAVGNTLTATNGTWRYAASFRYQWQHCDQNGNNCVNIPGATGQTYGIRTSDVGMGLRVNVTATNRFGSRTATSDKTALVPTPVPQTTTTVVTVQGNTAPSLKFISLKRVGLKVYARFRTCDDSSSRITIVERTTKARALGLKRKFRVNGCGTFSRSWTMAKRFRSSGKLVVSLRAVDTQGRLSRLVSKSLRLRLS
jgi:hypothetical protein